MKRKNLIATRKVKKNKLLLKDPKILNFYTKFKSIIFKAFLLDTITPSDLYEIQKI